jgi:hypothetical protein
MNQVMNQAMFDIFAPRISTLLLFSLTPAAFSYGAFQVSHLNLTDL